MSSSYERAADALDAAFEGDNKVTVEMTVQDLAVLRNMLESVFHAVRSGKVDEVKQVTGVETMIDAAHLISIRKALGD